MQIYNIIYKADNFFSSYVKQTAAVYIVFVVFMKINKDF
jgi:hypothetical protein